MLLRYIIILHTLFLLVACNSKSQNSNHLDNTEINKDSIFERFEDIAYNHSNLYISNPDSFLNTLKIEPTTIYQKELYVYGIIFMGATLMENGILYESVKSYEKAYNYAKKENIEIEDVNNTIIKPLANLYTRINDTEKAINLLENTLAKSKNIKDNIGLSNNLANAYLYNNQTEKAKKILNEHITNAEAPLSKALLENSLASIYHENKDLKNSIKHNNNALENFKRQHISGDTILWYCSALGMYAELHDDHTYIQKAFKILNENYPKTHTRLKAKLLSIEAEIFKSYDSKESLDRCNLIIDLLTKENKNNTLDYTYTKALIGKAKHFKTTNQIDSALYYYEQAIANDFKTQQLITSPKDQIRNNLYNKNTLKELIEIIDAHDSLKTNPLVAQQLLWCIELSKARLLINEINRSDQWNNSNIDTKSAIHKIQNLYQQKDLADNNLHKKKIQQKIDQLLTEFQLSEKYFEAIRFIPQKEKFINNLKSNNTDYYAYYVDEKQDIIFIHTANGTSSYHKVKIPSFALKVDSFKNQYFGITPNAYNNNPKKYYSESKNIAQILLPNLTNENVFISLDGHLYGLPFDALIKDDFLVYNHNFGYLNSFLLFDILKSQPNKKSTISLLFRSDYSPPLPPLGFVAKEVDNISNSFKAEVIGTSEQTDEVLKTQFAKSSIIHIAAHTILDSSEAPIIYLKNPISTNQIRYFEIKSPLVFLSACNTGTGESLPAEGTESIQRVFLSKSVPSVISTYWFANDETMLNITDKFYQALNKSQNPIHALAEAKRQYLLATNQQYQNPWYWANINYSGINNNIGLKQSSNLYCYISILLAAITTIVYVIRRYNRKA